MTTASPVLTIGGLVKRFGQRTILDGIGMTVMPGEIVCLVGPSGTGKSTLLRCINGLEGIQSGHIVFDGLKVRAHARDVIEVRKRIGMIFQQFNLYPHLTALQNVMLAPVVVHREARQAVEARARALLDRVRLSHRIDAYPNQLSGGEQQRVAIARALVHEPQLLLADEPTGNLDEESAREMLPALLSLTRARGATLVMVTHDEALAATADRVLELREGRLQERRAVPGQPP